jgi:hypothetical protein
LYYSEFSDYYSLDEILSTVEEDGVDFIALTSPLSDGSFFTVKYAVVYTPGYKMKALYVRDYNASTENDAFLQWKRIYTPYTLAMRLYVNKSSIDRIELYDNNNNLVESIGSVFINNPDVTPEVLESFIEEGFYDNESLSKMIVRFISTPPEILVVTKEYPTFTNHMYVINDRFSYYKWRILFFYTTLTDFAYYPRLGLYDVIERIAPALVPSSGVSYPA